MPVLYAYSEWARRVVPGFYEKGRGGHQPGHKLRVVPCPKQGAWVDTLFPIAEKKEIINTLPPYPSAWGLWGESTTGEREGLGGGGWDWARMHHGAEAAGRPRSVGGPPPSPTEPPAVESV
jgi:hypothetical protein